MDREVPGSPDDDDPEVPEVAEVAGGCAEVV